MSSFNFDPYTYITRSRRMDVPRGEEPWYTLYSLTACEHCGAPATEEQSPHIRSETFFIEALNAGMIEATYMPDQLNWCAETGAAVCFECEVY